MTSEQLAHFEAELHALTALDYVDQVRYGRPAATEERPVTDHSFQYSLSVQFKNQKDHDFYQEECPVHLRFVAQCKAYFERVIVYDTALA